MFARPTCQPCTSYTLYVGAVCDIRHCLRLQTCSLKRSSRNQYTIVQQQKSAQSFQRQEALLLSLLAFLMPIMLFRFLFPLLFFFIFLSRFRVLAFFPGSVPSSLSVARLAGD